MRPAGAEACATTPRPWSEQRRRGGSHGKGRGEHLLAKPARCRAWRPPGHPRPRGARGTPPRPPERGRPRRLPSHSAPGLPAPLGAAARPRLSSPCGSAACRGLRAHTARSACGPSAAAAAAPRRSRTPPWRPQAPARLSVRPSAAPLPAPATAPGRGAARSPPPRRVPTAGGSAWASHGRVTPSGRAPRPRPARPRPCRPARQSRTSSARRGPMSARGWGRGARDQRRGGAAGAAANGAATRLRRARAAPPWPQGGTRGRDGGSAQRGWGQHGPGCLFSEDRSERTLGKPEPHSSGQPHRGGWCLPQIGLRALINRR